MNVAEMPQAKLGEEYVKQGRNVIDLLNALEQAMKDAVALRSYWQPSEMEKISVEGLAQLQLPRRPTLPL